MEVRETLFVIPARGGSKGIPGKNIKPLAGKPLICYSIDVARDFVSDADICVSTDDAATIALVEGYGLPVRFVRPSSLAGDTARSEDVLLHALEFYRLQGIDYKRLVLLQPTSPFRTAKDVANALAVYTDGVDMVVSVVETKSNPYYVLFEENGEGFLEPCMKGNFTRRQDCPKVFEYNGAVYVINAGSLKQMGMSGFTRIRKVVMDEFSSLDLDTPLDWEVAEARMRATIGGDRF